MKKLLLAVALGGIVTSVQANSVTTTSTTGDLPATCQFSSITNGTMTWDDDLEQFDLTINPSFTTKVRGFSAVTVSTDSKLYDDGGNLVDTFQNLTYYGSTVSPQSPTATLAYSDGSSLVIDNFSEPMYFDVTLQHGTDTSSYFVPQSNTTYTLTHTITCTL